MTSPLVPPLYVELPSPPVQSYGLFTVATGPMELSVHGIGGGVEYDQDYCTDARPYPAVCDTTPPSKTFDAVDPTLASMPFRLYTTLTCGSLGATAGELEARAQRRFAAAEQRGVELAFWGIDAVDVPDYLHDVTAPAVTNLGAATTVVGAIYLLEQHLAGCYGSQGIIHARPRMAAYLGQAGILKDGSKVGDPIRTWRGNLVSFGDGYSGNGVANDPPTGTTEWLYVTGRVFIWRSPDILIPDLRQTFNRTTNQYNVLAERDYSIAVECCIGAVEVTLPAA